MKKRIDVELLLRWAYRDELPKKSIGEVSSWESFAELGQMVDDHGTPGFPVALGAPHPDALMVDHAVRKLEPVGLDWRRSRASLMGDLVRLTDATDPRLVHLSVDPRALVEMHARMGTRPVWDLGPITIHRVSGRNGKPVVQSLDDDGKLVDGRTSGRHYGPMSRCPVRWEPEPVEIATARAEYAVWHAGLIRVTDTLRAWTLGDHEATTPAAPREPWITGETPKPRILPSLSVHNTTSRVYEAHAT